MRVWWMLMILLDCRSLPATESLCSCTCNERIETVCVPAGAGVTVPCPQVTAKEAIFGLFKDQDLISQHTCKHEQGASRWTQKTTNSSAGVELNTEDASVTFAISGVAANHSGHYRCEAMITFPPPYLKVCNASRVQVHVEGHQCKLDAGCVDLDPNAGEYPPFWIWILGLVALSAYSAIVTVVALTCWLRLRRMDSQSDYMNTKPRAPRGHKWRGIQRPIPRHF